VSVPKQTIGLTNFSGSISKCPPNPDAIRSIVFTKCDNLAVVNGASTEILIPLTDFFVPVTGAARISFTIPGATTSTPYIIHKLDLGGVDNGSGQVKFIGLMPQYSAGSTCTNCPGSTQSNSLFLEWTNVSSIDKGELYTEASIGVTGNTRFAFSQINKLQFSWGTYLSYDNSGGGKLYAATYGGLLKWNGSKMSLLNTLNSNIPSDYVNAIDIDPNNAIWLATNNGLYQFKDDGNPNGFKAYQPPPFVSIPANCLDVKLYNYTKAAVGSDMGISILDTTGSTCLSYNIYNAPLLKHNYISKVDVSTDLIVFAGTTGGVYFYDTKTNLWGKYPLNATTVTGWSGPSAVTSLASYNGNLYVGTTGGLVAIPYTGITGATTSPFIGITASTIYGGASGPYSSNFSSLRYVDYGGLPELWAGHGSSGAISKLDIDSGVWDFTVANATLATGPVNDVLPDYLSGSIGAKTVFTGGVNATGPAESSSGIVKILTSPGLFDSVPGASDLTDILFSSPNGLTVGNYNFDSSRLYSAGYSQPNGSDTSQVIILFSKGVEASVLTNYLSLSVGLTGAGATVGIDSYTFDTRKKIHFAYATGSTGAPELLQKAAGYNLRLAMGLTATDNTVVSQGLNIGFYTENIDPVLGWNKLGKMLVLSGSDNNYIEDIYLRNPQGIDINVIALIGK
jgi:hypothetical protein